MAAMPIRTICSHPVAGSIGTSLQPRFAVEEYYAPLFPGVEWRYKFIGGPTQTPRYFALSWFTNGTGSCDALLGPGSSSLALSISPLVNVPWIDFASTSTALSDKSMYPAFSRDIPVDTVGAETLINAVVSYGWTEVNVLAVDSTYGSSLSSGIARALAAVGGFVNTQRVIPVSATNTTISAALDSFLQSECRVVMVGMARADAAFAVLRSVVLARNLSAQFVFLFAESFCSSPNALYLSWDGALCATYVVNATRKAPFINAFLSRNVTNESNSLASAGWNVSAVNLYNDNTFTAMAHDAALLMMTVLHGVALSSTPSRSLDNMLQLLRGTTIDGITGSFHLDANGDRPQANALLYNVVGGVQMVLGSITNMRLQQNSSAQAFVLGTYYDQAQMPSGLWPRNATAAPTPANSASVELLIAVVAGGAMFIGLLFLANKLRSTEMFKQLMRNGLMATTIYAIILAGIIALRVVAAIVAFDVPSIALRATYTAATVLSMAATAAEGVMVLLVFAAELTASTKILDEHDAAEDVVASREASLNEVHVYALWVDHTPLLALSAVVLVNYFEHSIPILVSLCVSCVFLGLGAADVHERVQQLLSAPPPRELRRFPTVRAAGRFILLAIRLGGGKFSFPDASQRKHMHANSSSEELTAFSRLLQESGKQRYRFVRSAAKTTSIMLRDADVTSDEFFGVITSIISARYDPTYADSVLLGGGAQSVMLFHRFGGGGGGGGLSGSRNGNTADIVSPMGGGGVQDVPPGRRASLMLQRRNSEFAANPLSQRDPRRSGPEDATPLTVEDV